MKALLFPWSFWKGVSPESSSASLPYSVKSSRCWRSSSWMLAVRLYTSTLESMADKANIVAQSLTVLKLKKKIEHTQFLRLIWGGRLCLNSPVTIKGTLSVHEHNCNLLPSRGLDNKYLSLQNLSQFESEQLRASIYDIRKHFKKSCLQLGSIYSTRFTQPPLPGTLLDQPSLSEEVINRSLLTWGGEQNERDL